MARVTGSTKKKSLNIYPYLFIAPTMIGLAVFKFYPFFIAIIKSFYRWSGSFIAGYGINKFVGLRNYIDLFQDKVFWISWKNVMFFVITGLIVNTVFPFLNAELIFGLKNGKHRYIYRVLFISPIVIPSITIFLLWKFIYNPQYGLVNRFIHLFNPDGFLAVLANPDLVKAGIRFMGFPWVGGMALLIYLAGLTSVDASVMDASLIDGASLWQRIMRIDLPMLAGQFKMIIILGFLDEIQDFVKVMVLTDGGPGFSSIVPGLYMYKQAFGESEYGYANAIGVVLLAVILLITYINNKLLKSQRE